MSTLAITGGTGFVGGEVIDQAVAAGVTVRALARAEQPAREGVSWITGTLDDGAALDTLMAGANAVLHIAGAVNAPNRAGFERANGTGTANLIMAMERAALKRLVHVSSLSAREPQLSDYGWSKAEAERHVLASHLDWTMVRPPAIYGGRDKDMLELFQMAKRGIMLLPPGGRLSVISVRDLARLLLALCADRSGVSSGKIYEVCDGRAEGWTQRDYAHAIGRAVGRPNVLPVPLPALALRCAARIDRLLRGANARLTPDRARYMCHPDWVSRPELWPPATLWTPQTETEAGLAQTAAAYRDKGWL